MNKYVKSVWVAAVVYVVTFSVNADFGGSLNEVGSYGGTNNGQKTYYFSSNLKVNREPIYL